MYESFAIMDPERGLYDGKPPWLSPPDAFRRLQNARSNRGRILKRNGFRFWTHVGHKVVNEALGTFVGGETVAGFNPIPVQPGLEIDVNNLAAFGNLPIMPPHDPNTVYTLTLELPPYHFRATPVAPDTLYPSIFLIEAYGAPLPPNPAFGELDLLTGRWYVALQGGDTFAAGNATASYEFDAQLPITGIQDFHDVVGTDRLFVTDTRRGFLYDGATGRMVDVTGGVDVWTGGEADLMNISVSQNTLVLNNFKDKPYLYDTVGGLRQQNIDLTTPGGTNKDVAKAAGTLFFKGRLLILRPTEGGADLHGSIRYSRVGQLEVFDGLDSFDLPTEGRITHGRLIGDRAIIFTDKPGYTFELVSEDDPTAPFTPRKLRGEGDAAARMGGADLLDEAIIWGSRRLLRCDGAEVLRVFQEEQPDIVRDSNLELASRVVGVNADQLEEIWLGFAAAGSDYVNEILAINHTTRALMRYSRDVTAFGQFRAATGLIYTWNNSFPITWNTAEFSWNEGSSAAGFPLVIVGSRDGRLWTPTTQFEDDVREGPFGLAKQQYEFLLETQALNPFAARGARSFALCRMGWVDIIAEANTGVSLTVEILQSFEGRAIVSKEISLTPAKPSDKRVVRRVAVDRVASGHIVRVRNTSASRIAIEAIVCGFAPAGEMRKVA